MNSVVSDGSPTSNIKSTNVGSPTSNIKSTNVGSPTSNIQSTNVGFPTSNFHQITDSDRWRSAYPHYFTTPSDASERWKRAYPNAKNTQYTDT